MEKNDIALVASQTTSKEDLLNLLNKIKVDALGKDAHLFQLRQICYYCNPNQTKYRYKRFDIPKKSGGVRNISAPVNGLKSILTYLNVILQAIYTPSQYAMGFVQGRSVVDNAKCHIGQNYVLNLDLKDFFPSISQARVWKRFQLSPFNLSIEMANLIAGLCCMKIEIDGKIKYILPQGAPTSPIITNMICDNLDRRLNGLAKRFGLRYTRYADDITFSSMHNIYQTDGEFMNELRRIIKGQNFTINENKTRLQKRGSRQEVTGLTVCEKPNVTRKYVHDIRSLLYIWERYGFDIASSRFILKYKTEKGYIKKGQPHLENVLSGKLLYLKMVKGENDSVYKSLQNRFEILMNNQSFLSYNGNSLIYIETMNMSEFEKKHSTKIKFPVSKKEKQTAFYLENSEQKNITISKNVIDVSAENLQISLCENIGKRFYLLHKPMLRAESIPSNNHRSLDDILSDLCNSNFDLSKL